MHTAILPRRDRCGLKTKAWIFGDLLLQEVAPFKDALCAQQSQHLSLACCSPFTVKPCKEFHFGYF